MTVATRAISGTSHSAMSSKAVSSRAMPSRAESLKARSLRVLCAAAVLLLSGAPLAAGATLSASYAAATPVAKTKAKVYLTTQEALELAFGEAEVRRSTIYLTAPELKRAKKLAKVPVRSAIVYAYSAYRNGELIGMAYFDTHKVRTLGETLMVVIDPKQRVQRLELLSFNEPPDYVPPTRWYGQFLNKKLDDDLNLKRDIRGVTGATLSARATTQAVRRVLALHGVLQERGSRALAR